MSVDTTLNLLININRSKFLLSFLVNESVIVLVKATYFVFPTLIVVNDLSSEALNNPNSVNKHRSASLILHIDQQDQWQ